MARCRMYSVTHSNAIPVGVHRDAVTYNRSHSYADSFTYGLPDGDTHPHVNADTGPHALRRSARGLRGGTAEDQRRL